jgi:hypothetical protein
MPFKYFPALLAVTALALLLGGPGFPAVQAQDEPPTGGELVCVEHHPPGNPSNVSYEWMSRAAGEHHVEQHEGDRILDDSEACPAPSPTPTASITATAISSNTPTPTETVVPTATATETRVPTATATATLAATATVTMTPATMVGICHRTGPPDNPRFNLIFVSPEGAENHLTHHEDDFLPSNGQCIPPEGGTQGPGGGRGQGNRGGNSDR